MPWKSRDYSFFQAERILGSIRSSYFKKLHNWKIYFGIDINYINYLLFGDALVCRPISHNKNSPKYPVWNFYRLFYFHMRQCKGHCVTFLNVYDLKLCEGKISMSVFVWRIISKKLLFTYSFCKNLPNVSASHHRHGDLLT